MTNVKLKILADVSGTSLSRRRTAMKFLGFGLMVPLMACGQDERITRKETVLNVEMYSYLDRPIHDIIFNGADLGVMNSYGGTGTITGVRIPFGVQTLTWELGGPEGMARNGEKVKIKNKIIFLPEKIPPGTRYIGLHLYSDNTAEITFAEFIPGRSATGGKILSARK